MKPRPITSSIQPVPANHPTKDALIHITQDGRLSGAGLIVFETSLRGQSVWSTRYRGQRCIGPAADMASATIEKAAFDMATR